MSHDSDFQRAKDCALSYLSKRSRCENEIRAHMRSYTQDIVEKVITFLTKYDFVNDRQYAKRYIRDRLNLKPRSLALISRELKRKGLLDADISAAIAELDSEIDESSIAFELAKKQIQRYQSLDQATMKRRLFNFLLRRGFSYELIRITLTKLKMID